jgi:AraC-like DNA-binding protein
MKQPLYAMHPMETLDSLKDYFFPPYITLAHIFNAPKGWEIKPRMLNQYQFQYVVEGAVTYEIEGRKILTRKGDLIYHSPNQLHSVKTLENEPYVCLSLVFHFGMSSFPIEQLLGEDRYLGNIENHPIEHKLSLLISHYQQPGLPHQVICQGLLMEICGELATRRSSSANSASVHEKTMAKLVLIRNYIFENYSKDIKLQHLESISGLSKNYIIIKYRRAFGLTPFEYLTRVRIERARELVLQSDLSIGEIAQRVGYADVHTFGRMFKNKTGTSVSQFISTLVAEK